jgi:riboflavin kinase/FMN adenylyltransferase
MRPHPREFFAPENAPNLLTADGKKETLLAEAGIDALFYLPFDGRTANTEPERFVADIIHTRCRAVSVVAGHDCRFGKGARGDVEMLRALGPEHGFTVEEVPALIVESERVSSTLIRERVLQGDLDKVEKLLGRKYSVTGEVVRGRGIGVTLGFPTANVRPHHSAIPAQGVYIAEANLRGRTHRAAVNIGIAPTIRHEDVTVEAHLLDYHGDLVGEQIEVIFHRRIRPEKKFRNREELQEQIAADIQTVRTYFGD